LDLSGAGCRAQEALVDSSTAIGIAVVTAIIVAVILFFATREQRIVLLRGRFRPE
jgi:hypothetical protein